MFQTLSHFRFVLSQICLTLTKFMKNILASTISNKYTIQICLGFDAINLIKAKDKTKMIVYDLERREY